MGIYEISNRNKIRKLDQIRHVTALGKDTYNNGKISVAFEIAHKSGSLYNILGNFIFNNVNMTMIESRPIPEKSFEYRFFVDFEGNLSDAGVRNALTGLAAEASVMRILGNY